MDNSFRHLKVVRTGSLISSSIFYSYTGWDKAGGRLRSKMRKELLVTYCVKTIRFLNEHGKLIKRVSMAKTLGFLRKSNYRSD